MEHTFTEPTGDRQSSQDESVMTSQQNTITHTHTKLHVFALTSTHIHTQLAGIETQIYMCKDVLYTQHSLFHMYISPEYINTQCYMLQLYM